MGLDATEMVSIIAEGTTGYFAEFAPILLFMAGIILAFGIMGYLVDLFFWIKERGDGSTRMSFRQWTRDRIDDDERD